MRGSARASASSLTHVRHSAVELADALADARAPLRSLGYVRVHSKIISDIG